MEFIHQLARSDGAKCWALFNKHNPDVFLFFLFFFFNKLKAEMLELQPLNAFMDNRCQVHSDNKGLKNRNYCGIFQTAESTSPVERTAEDVGEYCMEADRHLISVALLILGPLSCSADVSVMQDFQYPMLLNRRGWSYPDAVSCVLVCSHNVLIASMRLGLCDMLILRDTFFLICFFYLR